MRARLGWLAWLVLVAACVVLPVHALYGNAGPFARQLVNSAPWKSLDECLLLFGALLAAMRWRRHGTAAGVVALAVFARRHGVDLTLALEALYVAGMYALGRLACPGAVPGAPWAQRALWHVFTGMVAWAAVTWVASALDVGTVSAIRWLAVAILGGALAIVAWGGRHALRMPVRPQGWLGAGIAALTITTVAMLSAKAAAALDSDSFWYGVNADRVLLGEGGLFHPQGLVVHVHYYPKLAESLQIPFLGLGSASLVTGFSLACWCLLLATCRELLRELGVVSARLAWAGALLATAVPAVLASAATAKGELLAAWLCLFALLAGLRLRHATGRDAAAWFAAGLVAALLAPLARLTAVPYAAALFAFVAWHGLRARPRQGVRDVATLAIAGAVAFVLVCWRSWALAGVALASPDLLVSLQAGLGWHLHDDIGRYEPVVRTPFPAGLWQSLFGPSQFIHQALFWMGNAWLPLLAAAFVSRGGCWAVRGAMPFLLALGLAMYVLLFAYRYGPDGADGNYFIVPIVVLHLAAWAGCTVGAAQAPRPLLTGAGAMLGLSLFMVLTTANWLPGLARLDANFRRTPFGELDRMAATRFRTSGMGPLAHALAAYPPGTRMVGDLDVADGGLFPVRYESLASIAWARPPLVESPAAIRAFLLTHGIRLVALGRDAPAPVAAPTRMALAGLEADGMARELNVEGAPVSLWELGGSTGVAADVKIAGRTLK